MIIVFVMEHSFAGLSPVVRGVDPYGTGGTCPPIFGVGDTIMNVHPNILE